ncbi:MAG: acyltransferase family protein [Sarcina ventriculi]|nr:acyltransferase family protein [Sarcina ventriculi]
MKNFKHINILKGLGIIAVVLGHVGSPFVKIIYMYHMALFFFISGYLYNDKYEKNIFRYILKKIKSLYVPFVIFEIILLTLRNTLIRLHIYDISQVNSINSFKDLSENLKYIITFNNMPGESMLGAVWFLKTLFYVSILYAIFNIVLKKVIKKENEYLKCLIIVVLAVLSFDLIYNGWNLAMYLNPNHKKVLSIFTDMFDFRNFLIMSIFYFGNLYKKNEHKFPINIYLAIISLITIYYNTRIATIDIAYYQFINPIFFFTSSLAGIYLNLYIKDKICNSKFSFRLIEYAGKLSIYIMMLHLLSCKLIDIIITNIYNLPKEILLGYPVTFYNKYMWILYTLVGVIIPIGIGISYNIIKTKFIKNKIKAYTIIKEYNNI